MTDDDLWSSVSAVCGVDLDQLTRSQRADVAKTVRELEELGVTPEEIKRAASRWRSIYPNARLTYRVLRHRWAEIAPSRRRPERPSLRVVEPPPEPAAPPPPDFLEALKKIGRMPE